MRFGDRRSRKVLAYLNLAVAAVLLYFFFEPIFVWNWGWKPFPEAGSAASVERSPGTLEDSRPRPLTQDLDRILEEALAAGALPSVSAAVALDGEIVWARAVGFADLAAEEPATAESQYRIGSSSKPVTATLAARLYEEGALDLDAPVRGYVPSFPAKEQPVTARQLLSHTAGIRHYGLCFCFPIWEYENTRHFESVDDALTVFAEDPLLFEPGTDFSYSSYGTVLLSAALEGAGQGSFLSLMDERVFRPLGMHRTAADLPTLENDRRVTFYEVRPGEYKEAYAVDNSLKWAGGGFVSTPSDLARLGSAWLSGSFLAPATRDLFWTPQTLANGEVNEQSYALGWRHGTTTTLFADERPVPVAHHNGTAKGSSSSFGLYPQQGLAISVLTNRSIQGAHAFWEIRGELARAVVERSRPTQEQSRKEGEAPAEKSPEA